MGIEIFENTFRHQIQENGEIGEQKNIFNGRIGTEDGPEFTVIRKAGYFQKIHRRKIRCCRSIS